MLPTTTTTTGGLSRRHFLGIVTGTGAALLAGCAVGPTSTDAATGSAAPSDASGSTTGSGSGSGSDDATTASAAASSLFDSSTVHEIEMTFDQTAYDEMIAAYQASGDKGWIAADLTIDGASYTQVGLRLKGNSSLQGLRGTQNGRVGPGGTASADDPSSLPWLVRFDKYVDGQEHEGYDEIVVRSNRTQTSLNEAVALELVGQAGLATELSFPTRLRVNGSDPALRLVLESPDGRWEKHNFEGDGILYKAEASGDYSYRGDDPASYEDVFDQETGDVDDLTPLIAFLQFVNESDDATFEAELADHLDVDAFARYLAMMDLVANSDDIDGPGNNSYLRYTTDTGRFTIVAWDLNLAFGSMGGGMGGGPAPGAQAATAARPGGAGGGGMGGRSNVLVQRFNATEAFVQRYDTAVADLTASLYTSGAATEILDRRAAVLTAQATDVVPAATVTSDAAAVATYFEA